MIRRNVFKTCLAGLVLGATEEIKLVIDLPVCPICKKDIKEGQKFVLEKRKGIWVPVHFSHAFEDAYVDIRDKEARELAERFSRKK